MLRPSCSHRSPTSPIHCSFHTAQTDPPTTPSQVDGKRLLFIDYSLAFKTLVPLKLFTKLRDLGLWSSEQMNPGFPYRKIIGGESRQLSTTLITEAPQSCVLSPLLYTLYSYNCVAISLNFIASILTIRVTSWFGNQKALQSGVRAAEHCTKSALPSL